MCRKNNALPNRVNLRNSPSLIHLKIWSNVYGGPFCSVLLWISWNAPEIICAWFKYNPEFKLIYQRMNGIKANKMSSISETVILRIYMYICFKLIIFSKCRVFRCIHFGKHMYTFNTQRAFFASPIKISLENKVC